MVEYLSDVRLYEDEFPPDRRPPPVAPGGGSKALEAREPVQMVELDAGAFRAVWELLEGEAKHRYPTRNIMASARAYLRAVDNFRSSYWAIHEPPPDPARRKLSRGGRASSNTPYPRRSLPPVDGRRKLIRRNPLTR